MAENPFNSPAYDEAYRRDSDMSDSQHAPEYFQQRSNNGSASDHQHQYDPYRGTGKETAESIMAGSQNPRPYTPTTAQQYDQSSSIGHGAGGSSLHGGSNQQGGAGGRTVRDPYPAWTADSQIPLSKEEIEDVFIDLTSKFGFQSENYRNMFDYLMVLLDSRASRMSPNQALLTLHADFIGGEHANYRKWYFAAQLNLDDAIGKTTTLGAELGRVPTLKKIVQPSVSKGLKVLDEASNRWRTAMQQMDPYDRIRQIALYMLCWGEAAQVRFMPECLDFIFKCADDYYRSPECQNRAEGVPEGLYLRAVIRPLYRFYRSQGYEVLDGKFVRRELDHENIIGYDDINQLFWYPESIAKIVLTDKTRLVDFPASQRFMKFDKIDWSKVFFKTYKETRSFGHLLVNFSRIWVAHISVFWYYTAFNSMPAYSARGVDAPKPRQLSATALGGAVSVVILLAVTLVESFYIVNQRAHLITRGFCLLFLLALTAGPSVFIFGFDDESNTALIVSYVQLFVSIFITLLLGIVPMGRLFGDRVGGKARKYMASQTFTASYAPLEARARAKSILLWVLIFGCKFTESYFFLTLSLKDPITALAHLKVQVCTVRWFGDSLCSNQPAFTLTIMYITDLVLFFLDTFLWYVIWNTVFSIARSFSLGLSIWTPWKDIFTRLPKRIYAKVLATSDMEVKYKPKVLVSQVWNAIIISMYREHLLSIENVQKLLYHQVTVAGSVPEEGKRTLRAPQFFTDQNIKGGAKTVFFPAGSEAERRISFFAQSLTTTIPEALPVDKMPTYTVLVPHYSEKILLSLREIIREEDQNTRVTLLEYLKQLHPVEWENFVKDTKILANESGGFPSSNSNILDEKTDNKKTDDIPFYTIGFKSATPEFTLRTRIWASLRAQTLYRTVSGFMNYSKAIKLLYRVENPEVVQLFGGNTDKLERELERMARRKFRFVISMQRYSKFNKEEHENAEFLLRAYPDLQIAYIDEEAPRKEGGEPRMFSALIDGHSEILPNGKRRPKFRIELPGNPILGDGKSDNQNHAIIFNRGEYLQLIDANQDNYLEECLKIRNILGEFEEYNISEQSPYSVAGKMEFSKAPVAIVGAREYIFSENIGILGDVAAGKEQTFGTLAARSLAQIGAKLHYGHPDILNTIYMTTRGGVSKAQKGLHLNEDIYAGMTAFGRGGRIKHTEYYQCGKGRDLGFGTILNFQTKIGTGMGEQMLSREYYYLGTQLPMDRFLSFYYGHPGFHVNNILVIFSIQCLVLCFVFLGTMNYRLEICNDGGAFQPGCYTLEPVFDWIKRCIISIFLVFFIAFLPLFLQELMERGTGKALQRLGKHFLSLSPLFEVFSTQIYTHSIISSLTYGGARYIATGRGFATTRISFAILFSRFAGPSIYMGMRLLLALIFITLSIWVPHLIYFWISTLAFVIAPFLFNPHQFSMSDFFIDYREFLRWMSRGNSRSHANSWIGYCRLSRTKITGYKKKRLGLPSEKNVPDVARAGWKTVLVSEITIPIFQALVFVVAYMFVESLPVGRAPNPLLRVLVISLGPIVFNAAVLIVFFFVSLLMGPMFKTNPKFGASIAAITHFLGVVGFIAFFEFLWYLEQFEAAPAVIGLIAVVAIQRAFFKTVISTILTREMKNDESNRAWWSGNWGSRGLGNSAATQPLREFVVKLVELTLFSADLIIGHLLLLLLAPPLLIPFIDRLHSTMLFWLRPSKQIRAPIYTFKVKQRRRVIVVKYALLFLLVLAGFVACIALPLAFHDKLAAVECSVCKSL